MNSFGIPHWIALPERRIAVFAKSNFDFRNKNVCAYMSSLPKHIMLYIIEAGLYVHTSMKSFDDLMILDIW